VANNDWCPSRSVTSVIFNGFLFIVVLPFYNGILLLSQA
jgi:hypothetical protein